MAKYAYAPLSIDENDRRPHHQRSSSQDGGHDDLVNQRMPMCIGVCILVAIVFVLSRTGADPSAQSLLKSRNNNNNDALPLVLNATVPPVNTAMTTTATTTTDGDVSSSSTDKCAGLVDPTNLDMGAIRAAAFANTPPHIIECAADNANCHLPSKERFAAVRQKGATIWMTGCSGAGKTTIATALEDILVKETRVQLRRRQFADGIESRFDILRS